MKTCDYESNLLFLWKLIIVMEFLRWDFDSFDDKNKLLIKIICVEKNDYFDEKFMVVKNHL